MQKGFTLVEMLAVVLILGIILLIGVPIYQGVQKSTNESIYNSKISNVLTKAEEYSEEHGVFIYDIRKMISLGLLTPDNEAGEFRDPRDNRNMLCDVIQVTLENGMYYANVSTGYNDDGSVRCYSDDELKSMNSIVKINFYKERDGLEQFPSCWVKANHVYAGYEFIGSPDVSNVNVTWGGVGTQLDNGRLDIYTDSLMNAEVQLHIEFDYNGKHIIQDISRNIRIDNESPRGYVTTGPGEEKSNNLSYVEWQLTDGDGSGVAGHIILDEESFRSKPCESYTVDEIPGSDQTRVGKHLNNGVYYICVKDNVGNITKNNEAEENRIEVKNVDQSSGDIKSFKIESRTPPYNLKEVKLITELKDETPSGYDMCVSHTGYLENCSWEEFNSSKDYTINGYDYGSEVEFYLSVRDSAGNVSNIASTYTIDNLQYLDLNGQLNGTNQANITNIGTCDIYINGSLSKTGVSDYYEKQVPGSTYEIKNCKANTGYRYKGSTSITGTIGRTGASAIYVPYVSLYTITYNMNGGTGSVASQTKEHGTNINLASASSTKTGYTYVGWNTNAAGTGTNYNVGASYGGNGNVTLYAKWNPNIITMTLDNQSATSAGTAKVYYKYNLNAYYSNNTATTSISSITKPSKTGYTFNGYYSAKNGGGTQYINANGSIVNNLYKAFASNTTIYAYWNVNSYTVTWNANGGSCNKSSSSHNYNSNIGTLPTCTRSNYTFLGWFTAASGGTQIATTTKVTSNVTYYAHWKQSGYTVSFNIRDPLKLLNGSIASQTVNPGGKATKPTTSLKSSPYQGARSNIAYFSDSSYRNLFNFNSPINANTTVYVRVFAGAHEAEDLDATPTCWSQTEKYDLKTKKNYTVRVWGTYTAIYYSNGKSPGTARMDILKSSDGDKYSRVQYFGECNGACGQYWFDNTVTLNNTTRFELQYGGSCNYNNIEEAWYDVYWEILGAS